MPDDQNHPPAFSAEAFVASMLKNQSAEAAIRQLGEENHKLRRRNNAINKELEGYKTRNPQNSVVLVGEDVTMWNEIKPVVAQLKEMGVKPTEAPERLKKAAELGAEVETMKKKTALQTLAKALNFDETVFGDLATLKGLEFSSQKVEIDDPDAPEGKKMVEQWYAKTGTENPVPVRDHPAVKPYLKALDVAASDEASPPKPANGTPPLPRQQKGNETPKPRKDAALKTVTQRYKTPGELSEAKK